MSITDGGPSGVVTGTYNYGAPVGGGRGGHQWPLFDSSQLDYSWARRNPAGNLDFLPPGFVIVLAEFVAVWNGTSTDDFEDGDATGTVKVSCGVATLEPDPRPR